MAPKLGGINFEENNQTKFSEVCRGRHHCHIGIGMQLIQIQRASDECAFPCSPSRASMLTGLYPQKNGIITNNVLLEDEIPSLGFLMQDSGRDAGYFGKSHLKGYMYRGILGSEPFQGNWYWKRIPDVKEYGLKKRKGGLGEDFPQLGFETWAGGWKHTCCYRELANVPFIIRVPGLIERNAVSRSLIESVDILPTLIDLLELPEVKGFQGKSFRKILSSPNTAFRDRVFIYWNGPSFINFDGRWKYALHPRSEIDELYDLIEDPGEINNLAQDIPIQMSSKKD